ncbi:MAG: DUF3617 family protein [Desulfobacterales bacterium]|nr:DUF3617 family protein [Desulfobacterales bacterium]
MLIKACTISVLCILLAMPPAWGLDFKPGKYEITVKMEMPGIPGGMPPQTMVQCLNEKNPVPDSSPDAQGCKMANMRTKGNTVTYTVNCPQQGMDAKMTGEMTYKGDSFEGTTKMSMGPEAGSMTVITVVKGRRIGKCD